MPLKAICHSLVADPHRLDAIAVMVGVDRLINPICQLLIAWPQEVDHSERVLFCQLTDTNFVQASPMLYMMSLALASCLLWPV